MCDGSVIAINHLISADPTILQLILYSDKFTAVNPLKVKMYKVGVFYMTRKLTTKVQQRPMSGQADMRENKEKRVNGNDK